MLTKTKYEALRRTLAELHEEIVAVDHPDAELRGLLVRALIEVQESLGRDGNLPDLSKNHEALRQHLDGNAERHRDRHPRLGKMFTAVLDALKRPGT